MARLSIKAFHGCFVLCALVFVAPNMGCNASSEHCTPGTQDCTCDANNSCISGLTCVVSGMCIAGTGGSSAILSTGGAGGDVGIGTGGATGGNASAGGSVMALGGALSTGGVVTSSGGMVSGGSDAGSAGDTTTGGSSDSTGTGGALASEFTLTSAELTEGGTFLDANTCASGMSFGSALSLAWSGYPGDTQSFALVMIDSTLTSMGDRLGYHSAFWNLPASVTSLPQGSWSTALMGAQSINNGYLGPCPNFGGGSETHTYVITLYALPDAMIASPGDFSTVESAQTLVQTLKDAALDTAILSGTSSASN